MYTKISQSVVLQLGLFDFCCFFFFNLSQLPFTITIPRFTSFSWITIFFSFTLFNSFSIKSGANWIHIHKQIVINFEFLVLFYMKITERKTDFFLLIFYIQISCTKNTSIRIDRKFETATMNEQRLCFISIKSQSKMRKKRKRSKRK